MEWYEYFIIGIVWMLIPLGILIKSLQENRFRKYQKEDAELLSKFVKQMK